MKNLALLEANLFLVAAALLRGSVARSRTGSDVVSSGYCLSRRTFSWKGLSSLNKVCLLLILFSF